MWYDIHIYFPATLININFVISLSVKHVINLVWPNCEMKEGKEHLKQLASLWKWPHLRAHVRGP